MENEEHPYGPPRKSDRSTQGLLAFIASLAVISWVYLAIITGVVFLYRLIWKTFRWKGIIPATLFAAFVWSQGKSVDLIVTLTVIFIMWLPYLILRTIARSSGAI